MAVTLQGSTLNNIHIGNSGSGGGGAISAVNSAQSNVTVTTTSTTYANAGASPLSVTVATGTSVLVSLSAHLNYGSSGDVYAAVEVSGETTIAASDDNCIVYVAPSGGQGASCSKTWLISGLTPGNNTFAIKYRTSTGATAQYLWRALVVQTLA